MSELTKCNYCHLQRMKAQAKEDGVKITMGVNRHGWITVTRSDDKEPIASFMQLTARCAC